MRRGAAAVRRSQWRVRAIAAAAVAVAIAGAIVATAGGVALSSASTTARSGASSETTTAGTGFSATIRRTEGGIPHITSSTYTGLGYGYGYAFAQDNICVMAEDYVTVDAERSRFFGPNGSYPQRGNGVTANNLDSDLFFQQIVDSHVIDELLAQAPPLGPEQEVRELVRGYVAGYNRYLSDVGGTSGVPDSSCRGKPWVRPITEADAYRRFYQLTELASADVVIDGIAEAAPPVSELGAGSPTAPEPSLEPQAIAQGLATRLPIKAAGSNAVAIGSAGTRDHKHGLLLGNPHFPWVGPERFYQAELTIPKKLQVEGASLFGVPLVLIGHTRNMAWSHTVSTAFRFTPFQLTLVPGKPTEYLYDGQPTPMTSRTVTVQALQEDGSLEPVSRTLYSARFGPIFNSLEGIPLPWTAQTAFALGDANSRNFRVFNHFLDTDRAQSTEEELQILEKYEGIPWVNTIVSDRGGHALYADIGSIPNVSNAKAKECDTAVGEATFALVGLPVLDGARSACNWDNDPDAVVPGIFGPSHLPHLLRSDYVTNSNNSFWLSNPKQPLTGFARIIGDEGTERSLRTRIGLIMTEEQIEEGGFTLDDMQNMAFSDRQYGGELVRDEAVNMCRSFPGGLAPSSGGPVAVGEACNVLAAWDLHENLDSKGAILFRRFWERALAVTGGPWKSPFAVSDPVHTPNGLDTSNPLVQEAFGDAINDLSGAGIPLDAAPGEVQYVTRHGQRIPLHGGPGDPDGEFNALGVEWTGSGFAENEFGSSYVQVVTWSKKACPEAATILTYSESSNSDSPFAGDQTELFSKKQWLTEHFCSKDVLEHTLSKIVIRGR
jgi:acyl-homoserine-lactone acylase